MAMVQEPTGELPEVADAELVVRASAGGTDAFGELYRRHADAAWRVAHAVTGNAEDAADAVSEAFTKVFRALPEGRLVDGTRFRPYLLAATRNAAVDVLRRTGRVRPTETTESLDSMAAGSGPSEQFVEGIDRSLVASAFRSLPERWRSVLWLTEVEGMAPSEAAPLLGISPNGAAQLAVRARAGLRQRFLQAHLRDDVPSGCRFTVEHLGAYVGGGLSPRDIAKVDQHLAGCAECERRHRELDDLGSNLRRAAIPLPLALAGLASGRWWHALHAAHHGGSSRSGASQTLRSLQRPLATASAGLLGMGILGAVLISPQADNPRADALPAALAPAGGAALPFIPATSTTLLPVTAADAAATAAAPTAVHTAAPAARPTTVITTPSLSNVTVPPVTTPKVVDSLTSDNPPASPPAVPSGGPSGGSGEPAVQSHVQLGGPGAPTQVDVQLGVGQGACNSADAAAIHQSSGDCTTPQPPSGPAQVTIDGSAVPAGVPHRAP